MSSNPPRLLVVGHPLLDLIVLDGASLVEKYNLNSNDARLAGPEHVPIYEEVLQNHKPIIVPGGDANIARAAAYILPKDDVAFMGSVGADSRGQTLLQANEREGVKNVVSLEEEEATGACAVLIQNYNRSLVTNLCAAQLFDSSHLQKPEIISLLEATSHVYISGYFLSNGIEPALEIATKALATGQLVTINLAAPFIVNIHTNQLGKILPFADFVLGNESEAMAWAVSNNVSTHDLSAIAAEIAKVPKLNTERPRVVVITNGGNPTVVVSSADLKAKEFAVKPVSVNDIVDTNGAGDSFAGGFVAALVLGKSVDEAVNVGHQLGAMCITQIGAQLKWPKENVL